MLSSFVIVAKIVHIDRMLCFMLIYQVIHKVCVGEFFFKNNTYIYIYIYFGFFYPHKPTEWHNDISKKKIYIYSLQVLINMDE